MGTYKPIPDRKATLVAFHKMVRHDALALSAQERVGRHSPGTETARKEILNVARHCEAAEEQYAIVLAFLSNEVPS
jgi:hypothetical protein